MNQPFPFFVFTIILLITSQCGSLSQNQDQKITIATAANMQFAMRKLATEFDKKTGIYCELIISSSGKLTTQIKEGAPYDLFVSADLNYPIEIYKMGMADSTPITYAFGNLVLFTLDDTKPTFEGLTKKEVQHIAMANPKTAPYGIAARETLESFNIYDNIKEKLVFGESISQVNQFIMSGSAEIGFTSLSTVLSPKMKKKGQWILIPDTAYSPISQALVILKRNDSTIQRSKQFVNFLFSNEGQKILSDFGYSLDEK